MNKLKQILQLFILTISLNAFGQSNFNYELSLSPVSVTNLPGLHSYAYAQYNGKWLIIGGRKDGLHARQPFNAFPASQNNTDIYAVDVANNQVWTSSVNALPTGLKEQLQSTNMNFYQDADTLYIIGGYSYTASEEDHITHPKMTSLIVSEVIDAIIGDEPIAPFFQQIEDDVFANTGGQMGKIGDYFYLIGGHRFDGRYNPMGNPTYVQTYKTGIQKFKIKNTSNDLSFSDYTFTEDPVHLRRRDYNLLPQVFPDGSEGYTISAGVFQINANLPFLYPVDITENDYTPITGFNQYLSHYHGAKTAIYDAQANEMHNLFYGGMSQYYYDNGNLIQDDEVPFVNTISRVTRDSNGNLQEFQMPVDMPGLKGAGSEFIPNLDAPYSSKKVLNINDVTEDSVLIGYIFGGIETQLRNPFSNNQTNQTSADASIFEVWLTVNPLSINEFEIDGKNPYQIEVFPNPFKNDFIVKFKMESSAKISYFITNNFGQIIQKTDNRHYPNGNNEIKIDLSRSSANEMLFLTVVFDNKYYVTKKLIRN